MCFAVQRRDTHLTPVTSECKMQEIVLNKVTPTRYTGHLQGGQQPPWHLRKPNPEDSKLSGRNIWFVYS